MKQSSSNNKLSPSSSSLANPPTLIEHGNLRFLIMDAPSDTTLPMYFKELKKHNVTDIVRACDPTYSVEPLNKQNIKVWDLSFPDGEPPPNSVMTTWLDLVNERFPKDSNPDCCIAVHCVAGLGRAPVLVAIALIERGMGTLDSVAFIREKRRGAINNKQLKFLEIYKRRSKKKDCIIC